MTIFRFLLKDKGNITVHSSRIDSDRFRIKTERGSEVKESTVVVFSTEELKNIDEAKNNILKQMKEKKEEDLISA